MALSRFHFYFKPGTMKNLKLKTNESAMIHRQNGKSYPTGFSPKGRSILFSPINFLTMEKSYKSTGVSSPSRTEQCLSLSKGVEVRTDRTLSLSKGSSPSFFKSFALTLAIIFAGIGGVWGQVNTYTFAQSAGTYAQVTGTNSTATGDDGTQTAIAIGFTFKFDNINYTTFSITTNGMVRMGGTAIASGWTNALGTTAALRPLIAPFWDDNHRNTGAITYATTGVAPNRVLSVSWHNINIGGGGLTSTTAFASYRMNLYETTNVIEFIYGPTMATAGAISASVGINGASTFLSVTPAASSTVSSTTANNNITATTNLVGKKFTFTPPPPAQPSVITGTLNAEPGTSQTYSVTNVSGVTYTWSFPATWTITAGQGTNSVTVTVGTANGTISVTPSNSSGSGTARTTTSTIPNYRWKYISSNLGAATWTGGEARTISITIKNTGVATWNTTYPNNIGVRWNTTNTSLSGLPWSDFHSRTSVGSLAPGASGTFSLSIEAKDASAGPVYTTNLADGTYYLAFDLVSEGQCWFSGNTGTCGPGNVVFYSAAQTVASTPSLSCSALTAFGNICTNATGTNSFTISGVNLSNDATIGALSGFTYSTSLTGTYTSTLTLTPSSGSINQTVYVKLTPTAAASYNGTIAVSSTGATSQNVSASGAGIAAPTVNAGSDFNLCSGQVVALAGSTDATSSSGTANSGTVTLTGTDNTNPTATYTFSGLPAGAVVSGITVNISSAGGANCPGWYSVTTRINGVQQGAAGCATNTTYTNFNGQAANGLVIAVRGQDNDAWGDAMTITYTVSLSYYVGVSPNPTYSWSPATALSATNTLTPNCSATSTTTYTLTVTGTNGCVASDDVVATVAGGSVPTTPTAAVSGSSTVNVGGAATLTSTAGANTLWFTSATGGTAVGSGSPFTSPVQCTSGSVTYYAEDNNGTCASNARGAVSFTVRPMVASNPANALICQAGGSVTLSTQLTGASGITWSPNTNLSTTSGASTVASPTTTTVYTMNATVAGCGSVSGTQTVGVIDAVAFTPTSTPTEVCAGNTAALASNLASAGFTYSTTTFAMASPSSPTNLVANGTTGVALASGTLDDGGWQNIPIGFTYNFFGNNYTTLNIGTNGVLQFGAYNATSLGDYTYATAFPTATEPTNIIAAAANDYYAYSGTIRYWTQGIAPTRTFVAEWNGVPGFTTNGSMTVQVKLFETTGIVEIHVQNASSTNNKVVGLQNADASIGATAYANTAAITNTAWKFIPGANYTFQWATAGSNIGGATATSYTTPVLSTPGTATYSVAATNPNTQCTTTQSVNITVNALPAAPNSLGDATACSTGGNQSLTVSTGAGETADWYAASTGGTVLASGDNVLTYSTATAGTYYAAAQNTTTGCVSASRTGVTLNVNTSPAAPTVSTPVAYCQGATASTLTATATGANILNWYSAAPSYPSVTGATALGSAPTPSTSTAGTTNYYVSQSSSSNSCESELALIAVTVNATPSAPVASNPSAYCQGATAFALTATSTAGNTLYWYTVPTGGTGSSTAPTPSTATAGTTDYYVADRTDASGCEGSRTTVTVTVNPTITASVSNSASSTSACGGGSITFTATPTNGGTPTYQWYLNGSAVSGETNATYTLATPNDADAIYVEMTPSAQTCLASSAATASNTVTLTSTAATPTVAIQSSSSSAFCPGTSVTFSVNSSANMGATPSYQWNLNGTPISGETNATLISTTLANNDQVTLTMTSSLSGACLTQSDATSSAIASTVNSATAISTQPAAASACLGGSQNFTVSATGTGTLTYQWKKNGSNVTGNATATTSTLTLSGIAAGDAANYTVDVTGTCGTVTSSSAALSINTATSIATQPTAVTQCAGTTANFSVSGSGQGTLSYQWRKDGSALTGETNSTLAVANIATVNAGQYSVIVSGVCGNVTSSNALLTVNSSTAISTQPVASTLCAGNTVNFSVTASGTGALSYQWKKDGSNVGTNSSTLSIANTQAANAGTYTVDVTGTCGTLTSNNALLTVNPLTTISTQPVATSGCEGQNTTFTVVAAGTTPLTYQWKFGGVNISGATAASFNIPSTTSADDGSYLVAVTGGCGTAVNSNTVALNVYDSPTIAASILTPDYTSTAMCGNKEVSVSAASIGVDSQGEWTVVGTSMILVDDPMSTVINVTAANSALGGSVKQLVWNVSRETSGNFCYSRDTINIDFKQPVITPIAGVVSTGDLLWGGLTDNTWATSSNWYQYQNDGTANAWVKLGQGQPSSTDKVYTLSNTVAGSCVSSSNAASVSSTGNSNDLYIGTGATVNLNTGNLTIQGDLVNNGSINPGTGTVTFNGTGTQTISGTGLVSNLNNMVVNKASGTVTLAQPVKVAGTLTMTQGDIITDGTNILEIGSSATAVGSVSWTAGTVRGPLKRWFATATNNTVASGVFPVGANIPGKGVINRYAQVNFTASPSEGGYVIAEYKTGTPSTGYTGLPLTYGPGQYIQNYEEEGYWDITPYDATGSAYAALNTAPYTLKLRMNNPSTLQAGLPPSGSNGNVIADISKLRIITSKGPSHNTWVLAGTQGAGHSVLASGDYLLEETGVTGFSFFNGGGNDNNPLPVELLNFNGTCEEGMVNLVWQTASEFNSSHFDVEKSTNGETWRVWQRYLQLEHPMSY